ncbi:hypothetical protein [Pseudovibrio sp. Ad46]|uniref:hypothetical protein n=1 Tax=Pseudovibrio sp. Ad46 TaxID=989432 RepID=UPI0007AEA1BF|nr:hypothetical protein [Pseudovibrio sp. Ad46]
MSNDQRKELDELQAKYDLLCILILGVYGRLGQEDQVHVQNQWSNEGIAWQNNWTANAGEYFVTTTYNSIEKQLSDVSISAARHAI